MIIPPPVRYDLAHTEELIEFVQTRDASRALRTHELMRHLPAGFVAGPTSSALLSDKADREASFSVYETDNPASSDQPFLLIVRTRHVVTIVNVRPDGTISSAGYSEFPAYGQMHTALLPARGAANLP